MGDRLKKTDIQEFISRELHRSCYNCTDLVTCACVCKNGNVITTKMIAYIDQWGCPICIYEFIQSPSDMPPIWEQGINADFYAYMEWTAKDISNPYYLLTFHFLTHLKSM